MIRWKVNKYNYDETVTENYLDVLNMCKEIRASLDRMEYSPIIYIRDRDSGKSRAIANENDWIEYVEVGMSEFTR